MRRRAFLGFTGAAAARLGITSLGRAQGVSGPPKGGATAPAELRLAGMSLAELRQRLYDQLFQVLLPFWDKHGIDHEYGGLMCSLDYDGTLLNTGKNLWFLGRAIWVYSFLYNHFGNNPQFLEVAKDQGICVQVRAPRRRLVGGRVVAGRESAEALQRRHGRNVPPRRGSPRVRCCQRRRPVP